MNPEPKTRNPRSTPSSPWSNMDIITSLLLRTHTPEGEIAFRMLLAVILGALIGYERETKNRPAGLRTHMLIALAAAIVAIVTLELGAIAERNGNHSDPGRALEAVTAGVAFLAAGTIIQARGQVMGITTGAGMWLAGAIGVASGFGMVVIAVMGGVLAVVVLSGLQSLSRKINPQTDDGTVISDAKK
jgi:putative Mg2+ transporter-C (MgtC) family protein